MENTIKVKHKPTNLDWARFVGQELGVRLMRGEITAKEAAALLYGPKSNGRLEVVIIAALETAAWLTDSLEVEFRVALNRKVVAESGMTS